MKIVISICLLFFSTTLFAQDTTHLSDNQIYRKWPGYKMDGKWLNKKSFQSEIYKIPESIPYYKKAKTNLIVAYAVYVPMIAAALLLKDPGSLGYYRHPNQNNIYYIAIIGTGSTGIYSLSRYKKYLKKAIKLHNEKMALAY